MCSGFYEFEFRLEIDMEVELVIVRHGETEANKSHIIQGHQDTALSELGLHQAQCVAKYLGRKYFLILQYL